MALPAEATPSVDDVAALMHEFVQREGGHLEITFTDETNPTAGQVQDIIDMQAPMVSIEFGDLTDAALVCAQADDVRAAVKTLFAQRVAAVVGLSYRPQDTVGGDTPEEFWRRIVEIDSEKIEAAASECRAGEIQPGDAGSGDGAGLAVAPVYQFQAGPRVGSRRW